MSKINFDTPTKLLEMSLEEKPKKVINIPDKIMANIPMVNKPTSFLLKTIDKERIDSLLKRVQPQIKKKISSADILRGILIVAKNIDDSVLLSAIKESFCE